MRQNVNKLVDDFFLNKCYNLNMKEGKKIDKNLIYFASDHNGFKIKKELIAYLEGLKYKCVDVGNTELDKIDDYVDYAEVAGRKVVLGSARGIFICGSGVGMCIAANKVRGVRAFNGASIKLARTSRADDNTNVLCLGARNINKTLAKRIIKTWLVTPFSNLKRHKRRVDKLNKL